MAPVILIENRLKRTQKATEPEVYYNCFWIRNEDLLNKIQRKDAKDTETQREK